MEPVNISGCEAGTAESYERKYFCITSASKSIETTSNPSPANSNESRNEPAPKSSARGLSPRSLISLSLLLNSSQRYSTVRVLQPNSFETSDRRSKINSLSGTCAPFGLAAPVASAGFLWVDPGDDGHPNNSLNTRNGRKAINSTNHATVTISNTTAAPAAATRNDRPRAGRRTDLQVMELDDIRRTAAHEHPSPGG